MTIDSHQHFWHYNPQRDTWITDEMSVLKKDFLPGDLLPELKANGVDGCIAVQADQSEAETQFLLRLAESHPEIHGVVGWVDLRAPNVAERLSSFSQFPKLSGFRHVVQVEADDRFMLRDDFLGGIAALEAFAFSYDILIYPRQLPAAIELAALFPRQPFVLDHIAKPPIRSGGLQPWAEQIAKLASHPNVYCKLSGMVTEADWHNWKPEHFRPYLDVVFAAFGANRLMFGSDWPVCLLGGTYRDVKNLLVSYTSLLPREHRERIFGLNAIEFYRLNSHRHGSGATR